MSEDKIISIKDFYNHETRISIVENAILGIEKRFDKIDERFDKLDNELKGIRKDMKSDFRWILTIISGLGAIMAHGFHWF